MAILTIEDISKKFGPKQVLDDLSLEVKRNTVYGFVGKNGSGKTTTMKLILGLYKPDRGRITINGVPVSYGQNHTNKFVGYLPDVPEFYDYMTPTEYLKLCAEITNIPVREVNDRVSEMLDLVGLKNDNKKIKGFSRGMKQRLGMAQALLSKPDLLICDEPTSALDPVGRKEILDIIKTVKDTTTVIFSTHILTDVERVSDHIGILNHGHIVWDGDMEKVRSMSHDQGIAIEFEEVDGRHKFVSLLKDMGENTVRLFGDDIDSEENTTVLEFEKAKSEAMNKAMEIICSNHIAIKKLEMREVSLENVFIEVLSK